MKLQLRTQKRSKYCYYSSFIFHFPDVTPKTDKECHKCDRVCFTRYVLAADCLEAVRKCISCIQYKLDDDCSTKSIAAVGLQASLRKCVPSALFNSFSDLGEILEESLIHQRLKNFSETSATKPPSSLLNGTSPNKLEFEQWERRLW